MNQELGPLLVEIYLDGAHIVGVCRQVQERRRLVDVLNQQDDVLELEEVSVSFGINMEPQYYDNLSVAKQAILAAVPLETLEQNRRRAVLTNMIGRQQTTRRALAVIVPPLAVKGLAHLPTTMGTMRGLGMFSKFFPITGATLTLPGGGERELQVILVSRDRVVGMSLAPAPRLALVA